MDMTTRCLEILAPFLRFLTGGVSSSDRFDWPAADYKAMTDFMSHAHGKLGQRFAELKVSFCQHTICGIL